MKRVAIIGAGASGLPAIKSCLEGGLEPVCFEKKNDIGGLWNFSPEVREGQACVMKSTITNTSKEMMAYSDFPPPKDFPMYLHNTQVLQYLRMYANHFDLLRHIRFKTEVVSVKALERDHTSKWTVVSKQIGTGSVTSEIFDDLMICSGHYSDRYVPYISGQENFQGNIMHSQDYKDFFGFENKKVVVIGIGNSGGDIAVELSRTASKVYLSTSDGRWIFSRISEAGKPMDMIHLNRVERGIVGCLPRSIVESLYMKKLKQRLNHRVYCLESKNGPFARGVLINDELPWRIACGSIVIKTSVEKINKNSVEFVDGTVAQNVDVIILATGYSFDFPFLKSPIPGLSKDRNRLYKFIFPPSSTQPNVCLIGCVQTVGPHPPVLEMQTRLAVGIFKGDIKLPSVSVQKEEIDRVRHMNKKMCVDSKGHFCTVDFIVYMDELADFIGCKPRLVQLFLTDARLAKLCLFGPCTPYQYRLQGPGKWTGARDAILSQWERTRFPLNTRPLPSKKESKNFLFLFMKVAFWLLAFWYIFSFVSYA